MGTGASPGTSIHRRSFRPKLVARFELLAICIYDLEYPLRASTRGREQTLNQVCFPPLACRKNKTYTFQEAKRGPPVCTIR